MSDSPRDNAPLTGGLKFAAKFVAGVMHLRALCQFEGVDGMADVSADNPLPVALMGGGSIAVSGTSASMPAVVDVSGSPGPVTVTVIPGAGNTSKAEYSTTPGAATHPGAANWQAWPPGTVSVIATDVFLGRLAALRFTRVTGSATDTYEVLA
ncbi:hypothetical protein SAMN02949497_1202 [Methylomagnum ishizawai]|uniref:Uncharacterized protein n=1 Tax=Methylomagnum ishizawai TaxID=1760988 RepID=A0A1Y6CUD0_9GAMM|nr:hypothetical protein [Methylomagnum ishizawai]SMF93906.1 hypothetical protein SAMN02949497_1202 [Methylomagnum ishizawai]